MTSKRFLDIAIVCALSVFLFGVASASALAESQNSPRLDPRICEWREEAIIADRCHADRFPIIVAGKDAGPGTGPSGAGTGGAASGDSGGTAASGGGQTKGGKKGDNGGGNGGGDGSPNGQNDGDR